MLCKSWSTTGDKLTELRLSHDPKGVVFDPSKLTAVCVCVGACNGGLSLAKD